MSVRTMLDQHKPSVQAHAAHHSALRQTVSVSPRADKAGAATGGSPSASPSGSALGHQFGRVSVLPTATRERPGADGGVGKDQQHARPVPRPHIALKRFSVHPVQPAESMGDMTVRAPAPDKSDNPSAEFQDQSASLTILEGTANGVHIEVEADGVYTSTEYPDGFKWTQTIDTNVPLGGTTSPYVDPRPNDDTKPFYWTDAEQNAHPTTFIDFPSRPAPATGTTTWNAVLALNGVDESAKKATAFDALTYGFTRDSTGTVTVVGPASTGTGTHRATLASEFPDWTFS